MNIENRLSDITADLVELEANTPFLERLFAIEAGRWVDAAYLCNGLTQRLREETVQVTWLDYPDAAPGKGYCLIIFFSEELHWSNVVLYNKAWFLRKDVGQKQTNPTGTSRSANSTHDR